MPPKLFKAAEVCELAQLQPYVLRSWEKEFPGIGVQKSADSARLYRQSDVDQVLRIKQLVFGEGLTLAGARRRLDDAAVEAPAATDSDVAEVLDALASDARTRIAHVRDGLRSILNVLSHAPGTVVVVDDFQLAPSNVEGLAPSNGGRRTPSAVVKPPAQKSRPAAKARSAAARSKPRTIAKAARGKSAKTKRSRANA